MAKITFSFSNTAGDIPTYEFSREEILKDDFLIVTDQLELMDDKVIVCFNSFKDAPYEYEHNDFYITRCPIDAEKHFYNQIEQDFTDDTSLDYNFFCFESYEEAFKYCIDLKEGL